MMGLVEWLKCLLIRYKALNSKRKMKNVRKKKKE
jgi:hypothetical protein